MNAIYSNKIFNWILVLISILTLIDSSYLFIRKFDVLNVIILGFFLCAISISSILSFFVKKLNDEFYTRLFIVSNLLLTLYIYCQFGLNKILYAITRTDLIANPIIHFRFLVGIILFFLTLKFSKKSTQQHETEYGIMMMIYGLFLIILNVTTLFDSSDFSVIKFIIKLLISFGILILGNWLRLKKIKFKLAVISVIILALICSFIIH